MSEENSELKGITKRVLESVIGKILAALIILVAGGVSGAVATACLAIPVPPGAVIAFDIEEGCPDGWRVHDRASGRVIAGVLTHPPDGERRIEFNDRDGEPEHVISSPTTIHAGDVALRLKPSATMPTGMPRVISEKIDNMPPFIGLWFCTPD